MIDDAILRYCRYQERCHSEARNKLYELGFTTDEVNRQLAGLIENGIVNEERYARAYARGKFRMMQWGRVKIKQQLKLKGISEYCIRKAMTEIDEDEYSGVLNKLAANKVASLKNDRSILSRKGKLFRFLAQKGFEKDLVMELANEMI